MRMILMSILLCLFDLSFGQNTPPTYYIPAGGQTLNSLTYGQIANQDFLVTTNGTVNLGSNTYTLTYANLPTSGTQWSVIFDATNLTVATNTNVNLFGETPLSTYYPIKKFYINFNVVYQGGVATKKVTYFSSLSDLRTFVSTTTFNGKVNINDTLNLYGLDTYLKPVSAITTGQTVIVTDTAGKLGFGCAPWCITGNSALSPSANFLGTTDTGSLRFRVNNVASGIIDYNAGSTAFGYSALKANTSGTGNTAIGGYSLLVNTTGFSNTAIGGTSLAANTTGQYNTGCGEASLTANTTGINNSGFGISSLLTNTTGSYNTAIGGLARCAAASSNYAIALGYNAIASSNQLAIAGIRSISIPQMTSAVNYVLTDTSGNGDFVARVLPTDPYLQGTTYTPLTGDSVSVVTQNNTINPAGTIANFTIRLPGTPTAWQIISLTSTQVITNLKWSTTLSSDADTVESHVPVSLTAGQAIKIQYNSTLSKWLNY